MVFPITTQANAALKPERLKGVEAGFDLTPLPGVTLGATAFYNRLDDAIANVTIGTNTRQRQNVNRIVAKGIELTASARLGDFGLSASYAYSHSEVDAPGKAFDGFAPAQTPRNSASATLAWTPAQGPTLSASVHYVSSQYEDDLQIDTLPRALTVDALARLPLGHGVALTARGENLFDEKVVTCQSACKRDPLSARKRDPLSRWRKVDRTRAFALRAA
ncbi:Outer membrane vitamin B12 receptor BtuB [hydrothermal vent metagenome]|uniref:Outer membrane vitamin B12 receptor BtuB n=1 Tax=hydrothermal vent metagenome TaxID=652676 RepID=A0A160TIT9_9ZZZZ